MYRAAADQTLGHGYDSNPSDLLHAITWPLTSRRVEEEVKVSVLTTT